MPDQELKRWTIESSIADWEENLDRAQDDGLVDVAILCCAQIVNLRQDLSELPDPS